MNLKQLIGRDALRGKPIRLNRTRLNPIKNKDYAEVIFFGDVHYGHPSCDIERARAMLDYCLKKKVYVIGMGDYLEVGTRNSVGDSVYKQTPGPQDQLDFIVEMFEPLAKKNLLIGLIHGNHEKRIENESGVNITKIICKALKTPYLNGACWNLVYVGKQSYTFYTLHGSSGSRYIYTKLKSVVDISHGFEADIIAQGHVHEIDTNAILVQRVDRGRKVVEERKKYIILTGGYLKYDESYAQEKGLPPSKMGSPKVKLFANRFDIHAST